ncbi:hypothetical protein [Candidatus Manganitrophus noduliformans]|uniref:Uncharacterized protein n=1 Tax=Candidatus Manganitrophus noduliformans TaxID=2606439 RepID=A0A7X6DMX6_9BACT|nr:hypothetical protein [Candidatus Manganitrophus noduliformans]NKE69873.1 hypothetical protein [Candidatus Manganitrophus noduliformans]
MILFPGDKIYFDSPLLGKVGPASVVSLTVDGILVDHPIVGTIVSIPREWVIEGAKEVKPKEVLFKLDGVNIQVKPIF